MANEKPAPAKPAAAEPSADAAPKKNPMMKMMVAGGVVVLLEVATVALTMMMSGGPKTVVANPPTTAKQEDIIREVEVPLVDNTRLPNKKSGRLYMYDLSIFAKIDEKSRAKVTEAFKDHEAELKDRLRTIIASTDTQTLAEPGLETLRRQIIYQLEQDLGKDLGKDTIKEILIPKCTPIPGEY